MLVLLTVLSCLLTLLFLAVLALYVHRIVHLLENIGSASHGHSSLEMIHWGVRAIEVETAHIPTEVTQLNSGLSLIAQRLKQIDDGLVAITAAATNQPRYR